MTVTAKPMTRTQNIIVLNSDNHTSIQYSNRPDLQKKSRNKSSHGIVGEPSLLVNRQKLELRSSCSNVSKLKINTIIASH